ncbi:MAG: PIN domain-containing protein [Bryobacteraceae bacterium]
MKNNFLLVDFENVQPKNVGGLNGRPFKIKVFVGANQAKIPFETARALQAFGPGAEYVQIDGNGKNALDFHIAYYIGRLAAENPNASFYVITKDKGFDPLIKHLKARGVSCQRSSSIGDVLEVKISGSKSIPDTVSKGKMSDSKSIPEKVDAVMQNLTKRRSGQPRTLKTLRGTIKALFRDKLTDTDLDAVIEQLTKRGLVKVADGKVSYELPPS